MYCYWENKNICVAALEALFGPDFDLVTSARFLPKTVLGILIRMTIMDLTNIVFMCILYK